MKIVYNACYGGFCGSDLLVERWNEAMPMLKVEDGYELVRYRTHPELVELVEQLGEAASEGLSFLRVAELSDDTTDYTIVENDGKENIYFVVDGKIFRY